jgi:hypothetical protein
MSMPIQELRRVDIKLNADIPDDLIRSLVDSLSRLDDINNCRVSMRNIDIEYSFPSMSFSQIWEIFMGHLEKSHFSFNQYLSNSIRAYKEGNEQAHLTGQYGWDKYIRHVYISHFHKSTRNTNHLLSGRFAPGIRISQLKDMS